MNRFYPDTSDAVLLELKTWQEVVIPLEPEDYDRANQLSRSLVSSDRQWQTYLNGLAFSGILEWLHDRTQQSIHTDQCTLLQPQYANVLDAVCQVEVGEFVLGLIVTESLAEEVAIVPRAVVELPEFVAHFYLLLEVQEEQAQVILRGYLRYDQLMHDLRQSNLQPETDWSYRLPLPWFESDTNHLLFHLRFLDPNAICLPAITASPQTRLVQVQQGLEERLSQIQPNTEPWQVLTWEQGAALLTCPPLLNVLQLGQQQGIETPAIAQKLQEVLQRLTGQAMNVWHWSQLAIDNMAQNLVWSMPQVFTPATAMRRTPEKFEVAMQDLVQQQAVEIPPQAHYAYTNLNDTNLQLCAVSWLLTPNGTSDSWALLLILVAQAGTVLPRDLKLQVSTTTILTEVVLETDDLYLYTLVEGSLTDEFVVTVLPPAALPVTLPPFVCHAD
jgi:hypothetical protein